MYNNRRQRTLLFMHDQMAPSRPGRFENRQVPLPHDWDAVLTAMYGTSYMTPPPREAQRPLHFRDRLSVDLDGHVAEVSIDGATPR